MGGEGVHSRFLKNLASELSFPLCMMFNSSLCERTLANIGYPLLCVTFIKKSFQCDTLNYRPVSLTSVPCKVLESIIVRKFCVYLEANSLLDPDQHGFDARYSTVDQLLSTYNDTSIMMDQGNSINLLFFDFAKAFVTICHSVLLSNLCCLGIHDELIDWKQYYLCNKSM